MATVARSSTNDGSTRLQDYLSDQIQTVADLDSVDDLMAKVREQQASLKKQLADAKRELAQAEAAASEGTEALRQMTTKFQNDQDDIDHRLHDLTESEVSDNAVKIFESRMDQLRRLEIARGYIELLKEVDSLSSEARSTSTTRRTALDNHSRLRAILAGLQRAQIAADQAAPHLVAQVEQQVKALFEELKSSLEADLQQSLEEMLWPKKDLKLLGNVVQAWQDQFESLLDLHEAEFRFETVDSPAPGQRSVILLPLQVMAKPLILRFQYHFYGDRPTNRLDKPEYFFSHILDLLDQHSPLMTQLVQPILDSRVRKEEQLELFYTDAISAFINALLPAVLTKCLSIIPQISKQPQLYSHFVHEMMVFDSTLRDAWAYAPVPGVFTDWRGLTYDILNQHGYFQSWLDTEKSFALSRYKKIRESAESNQIDYDTVEPNQTKPTKGAIRINDLLETITDRYKSLSSFSQRLTFLIDIQISIFDDYHRHLLDAFQAYVANSHTLGRLIQGGAQSQDDAMGMKGLETLVKVFGSSEYLERKMSDWSEDIFFLEMWDELQDRAKRNMSARNGTVGQNLALDDVAAKTSSTIKASTDAKSEMDGVGDDDREGGALFDETCASFRSLRERAEQEIVRALGTLSRNALKPYFDVSIWASLSLTSSASDVNSLSPTSALDTFLSTYSTLLSFLAKALATAPLRRLTRQLCHSVQKDVIDNVVNRHSFSAAGALQLRRDVHAVQEMIDRNTIAIVTGRDHQRTGSGSITRPTHPPTGEAQKSMKRLDDILTLLNLPIKASSSSSNLLTPTLTPSESHEDDDNDGWGFDEVETELESKPNTKTETETATEPFLHRSSTDDSNTNTTYSLWEVEKAIFASNESARRALAAMEIDSLGETEARAVIRRRVEIGS